MAAGRQSSRDYSYGKFGVHVAVNTSKICIRLYAKEPLAAARSKKDWVFLMFQEGLFTKMIEREYFNMAKDGNKNYDLIFSLLNLDFLRSSRSCERASVIARTRKILRLNGSHEQLTHISKMCEPLMKSCLLADLLS
jgi:hypothetical protein